MKSISFPRVNRDRKSWSNPKKDKHYYVCIENIEQIKEDTYEIILDGIESSKLSFYGQSNLIESYEDIEPYLFSVNIDKEGYTLFKKIFNGGSYRSKWYYIRVTKNETELPVSIIKEDYTNQESITEELFITTINQININNGISKVLNKYFSWSDFKLSNKAELSDFLISSYSTKDSFIHKLNVYNVGQGSLTAITNEHNVPLLYFDFGGGFAWNKSTYPISDTLQLCFSYTRTVIISHWDGDHVETAKRYFANNAEILENITWIVPEQDISPMHFKLAAKMRASGNLLIWPKTLTGKISSWFGELIKCNGTSKNHSGLAMIVDSPNNSIQKVLNPADAAYKYIPNIKKIKFDGLVATHHGANFADNNLPVPISNSENCNIAYSYGTDNSYDHPKHTAVVAHNTNHWINVLNTEDGNISFTTSNNTLNVPCENDHCGLNIIQIF